MNDNQDSQYWEKKEDLVKVLNSYEVCPTCNGSGQKVEVDEFGREKTTKCSTCNGEGIVQK